MANQHERPPGIGLVTTTISAAQFFRKWSTLPSLIFRVFSVEMRNTADAPSG